MSSNENPAPHHETPAFGNPDLPQEGMVTTAGVGRDRAGDLPHVAGQAGAQLLTELPGPIVERFLQARGSVAPPPAELAADAVPAILGRAAAA